MRGLTRLLGLLLLAVALPVAAHPVKETLREQQKALDQVRRQLRQERALADRARRQEGSLLAELEATDRLLAVKRRELSRLDVRLQRLERELRALEGDRGALAQRLTAQQEAAAERLRRLYKLVAVAPGPLLSPGEEARAGAARALRTLALHDLRLIEAYGARAERLTVRQEAVERHRRELGALRQAAERERQAIDREAERRRVLLARVREDRVTRERMALELEEAGRRLEALIRDLTRKVAVARKRPPVDGRVAPEVGFGALRGRLPWPAAGRVVGGFGRQVHPRFGTQTQRNGVEIEAVEGSEIRAVYDGAVLYTGWFKGYGNLIILDHGHGYTTVYAHASEILVREDERVSQGQVIGRIGETGSLDGPRLYFEVRAQGRPEDPQEWLRRGL